MGKGSHPWANLFRRRSVDGWAPRLDYSQSQRTAQGGKVMRTSIGFDLSEGVSPDSRSPGVWRGRINLKPEFPQPMEFIQQCSTAKPERLGSLGPVKTVLAQGEKDRLSFEVLQTAGLQGQPFRGLRRVLLDTGGEMFRQDEVAMGHQHGTLDRVAQFANIAGPFVSLQKTGNT